MTETPVEDTTEAKSEPTVKFEVKGEVLDLSLVNRPTRRFLESQGNKFKRKYADLVGPGGERPTIIVRMKGLLDRKLEVAIEYPENMAEQVKGHEKAERVA